MAYHDINICVLKLISPVTIIFLTTRRNDYTIYNSKNKEIKNKE